MSIYLLSILKTSPKYGRKKSCANEEPLYFTLSLVS